MTNDNINPILQEDNTDVDVSLPLLPPKQEILFVVKDITTSTSEKTGAELVNITLATAEPLRDVTDTKDVRAGFPIYDRISLTPTPNYSKDDIKRRLATFQKACGIKGSFWPIERFKGAHVKAVLAMTKATDEYPDPRNQVNRYVVPKD